MTQDISKILEGWAFDPHELTVRLIQGQDGAQRIQMRIEMGLLQMHLDGRPDGRQPHGFPSLLEYYEQQAESYGRGYHLSPEAIDELHREGYQYYQRYLCFYQLGHYDHVVRDTERNLRLFAFVRRHAKKRRDHWRFDQYRPYLIMMNIRARATMALQAGDRQGALAVVKAGRAQILDFLSEYAEQCEASECFELDFLTHWLEELESAGEGAALSTTNGNELKKLRRYLKKAINREDYEYAALLRDQIHRLEQSDRLSSP